MKVLKDFKAPPGLGREDKNYFLKNFRQFLILTLKESKEDGRSDKPIHSTSVLNFSFPSSSKIIKNPIKMLTVLISLVFLASTLSLWRQSCSIVAFGIALHIGIDKAFDDLVTAVAPLPPCLYLDHAAAHLSFVRRRRWMGNFLRVRHQIGPAQQLQVGVLHLLRFAFFTGGRRGFASAAGDRCRFLAVQRRKGEIIILRWILRAMVPLNLLQALVELRVRRRHRRCGDGVGRATN